MRIALGIAGVVAATGTLAYCYSTMYHLSVPRPNSPVHSSISREPSAVAAPMASPQSPNSATPSTSEPTTGTNDVAGKTLAAGRDATSLDEALEVLQSVNARPALRTETLEKLAANLHHLSADEITRLMDVLRGLLRPPRFDQAPLNDAVRLFASVAMLQKERGQWSGTIAQQDGELLTTLAADDGAMPAGRFEALKALGLLDVKEAIPAVRAMLVDRPGIEPPEALRGACDALVRLDPENALTPVSDVVRSTQDQTVFDAGTHAISEIGTPQAMATIVDNGDRFPGSASYSAALANMSNTVMDVLAQPQAAELPQAIRATEQLWREKQRQQYAPLLVQVVATAPVDESKLAADRLLDMASRLGIEHEKQELAATLEAVEARPELSDYATRIRNRLTATVLTPDPNSAIPAPAGTGNGF